MTVINPDVQQYFSEMEKLEQQKLGYKAVSKGRPSGAKNKKKASAEK